ncbi:helix-turn-helix transcriptional regulator [Streptomyces sp. NPDC000410]|uniref:helix-turn-helix domain-containing protein n=1 Tax=Streptomyces sp. NPDC000410 TaxID=3154254 RepID=UPI003322BE4C
MGSETDGFAGLLSTLKERSGLSYGALARQLHMSTSTLHRYCNGDVVPTDYAPLERLARLCGASPDELVELHRRWILADEARRRGRAGAPEAAASVEAAERTGEPEPQPGPEPQPEPGPEEVAAKPVVIGPEPVGSRKRRLRVALATAVVVALAVPAAVAVTSFGGGGGGGGGDAKTDGRGGKDRHAEAGPGAVTRSPTSSSASAAPSTSAGASPDGKKTSTAPSGPAAANKPKPPVRESGPVAPNVGISSYNWESPCGEQYLVNQPPNQIPPPPPPQDRRGWANALDAVRAGTMQLQLTVTGNTERAVLLNDVHVRVVGRNAPLDWEAYSMGTGCGSGITPQTFDIDLDSARPTTKPVAGQDGDIVVPAKDFPYQVSTRDPQVLNLNVHTEGHEVLWYLELDWNSGDQKGTIRVDDGGKPFRTSAFDEPKLRYYWPEKAEWATG